VDDIIPHRVKGESLLTVHSCGRLLQLRSCRHCQHQVGDIARDRLEWVSPEKSIQPRPCQDGWGQRTPALILLLWVQQVWQQQQWPSNQSHSRWLTSTLPKPPRCMELGHTDKAGAVYSVAKNHGLCCVVSLGLLLMMTGMGCLLGSILAFGKTSYLNDAVSLLQQGTPWRLT